MFIVPRMVPRMVGQMGGSFHLLDMLVVCFVEATVSVLFQEQMHSLGSFQAFIRVSRLFLPCYNKLQTKEKRLVFFLN